MRETRNLVAVDQDVALHAEVYLSRDDPAVGVFMLSAVNLSGAPVTRDQVLAWALELGSQMYQEVRR